MCLSVILFVHVLFFSSLFNYKFNDVNNSKISRLLFNSGLPQILSYKKYIIDR